jgi:hypothetical protein
MSYVGYKWRVAEVTRQAGRMPREAVKHPVAGKIYFIPGTMEEQVMGTIMGTITTPLIMSARKIRPQKKLAPGAGFIL